MLILNLFCCNNTKVKPVIKIACIIVCVFVCLFVCAGMCVCVCVRLCVCLYLSGCICLCVCLSVCLCLCICLRARLCVCLCLWVCLLYVCISVHLSVQEYICRCGNRNILVNVASLSVWLHGMKTIISNQRTLRHFHFFDFKLYANYNHLNPNNHFS